MIIHHYSPDTFDFVISGNADKSPLEQDVFLIPAFATAIDPPGYDSATQTCRFVDGAWQVEDIPVLPIEPEQAQKTAGEIRIEAIKAELSALDIKRIRPLAEGDAEWLKTYNDQAVVLREELKALAG